MVDVVVMQSSRRSHAGLRKLGLLVTVCVQLWIQGSLTSYAVALREATERHSTLQVNRSHRAPSHSHMHLSLAYPPVWSIPTLPTLLPTRLCPSLPTSVPSCGIVWAIRYVRQAVLRDAESGMRRLKNDTKSCDTLGRGMSPSLPPSLPPPSAPSLPSSLDRLIV